MTAGAIKTVTAGQEARRDLAAQFFIMPDHQTLETRQAVLGAN
jgi:hypothetical protein